MIIKTTDNPRVIDLRDHFIYLRIRLLIILAKSSKIKILNAIFLFLCNFFENLPTYAHFTCVLLFLIKFPSL